MNQIQKYMNKVEDVIASSSKKKAPKGAGLLTSKKQEEPMKASSDIEVIAAFVSGIRKAKEEMLNGNA
jgi:hypothetical protein